jgi:hypothetical protein
MNAPFKSNFPTFGVRDEEVPVGVTGSGVDRLEDSDGQAELGQGVKRNAAGRVKTLADGKHSVPFVSVGAEVSATAFSDCEVCAQRLEQPTMQRSQHKILGARAACLECRVLALDGLQGPWNRGVAACCITVLTYEVLPYE